MVADYICHCPPCSRGKNCEIHDDDCRYDSTFKPFLKFTTINPPIIQTPFEFGASSNHLNTLRKQEVNGGSGNATGATLDLGIVLSAVAVGAVAVIIPLLAVGLCCYFRRRNRKSKHPDSTYISGPSVLDVEAHQQNLVNQAKLAQHQSHLVAVADDYGYTAVPKKINNNDRYVSAKKNLVLETLQERHMPDFKQNNLYSPSGDCSAPDKVYCQLPSPLRKCQPDRTCSRTDTTIDSGLNSPESDICGVSDVLDVRKPQRLLGRDVSVDSAISCDSRKSPVRQNFHSDSSSRRPTEWSSKVSGTDGLGTNV